jgi:oligopeptide transport system substrate-binding protein
MGWKTLSLAFGLLVLLAGCSGSSSSDSSETTKKTPEATASSSAAETSGTEDSGEPLEGGRFVRLFVDPPTLDPHLTTDATSAQIIVEVFGGLVTIDADLNVVADLAESWDISTDGLVYTFRIRPDATFHNGKPVTAEDVRWSLERATNPLTEAPNVDQYLGDIVGVDAKLTAMHWKFPASASSTSAPLKSQSTNPSRSSWPSSLTQRPLF